MSDKITILTCAENIKLCKTIRPNEVVNYDRARHFSATEVEIPDLARLYLLLARLMRTPRSCVVRGALIDPHRSRWIQRRLYDDRETGECATLRDVPRSWLALDIDGVEAPDGLDTADLAACARIAIDGLPAPFSAAACIAQATASHGIKAGIRLRLWYWLDRPVHGKQLTWWLRGTRADTAIFRAAQVIYTAAPRFEGMPDPLNHRMVRLPGAAMVEVPPPRVITQPPPPPPRPIPKREEWHASRYASAALQNAMIRVSGAPKDARHATCVSQSMNLARLVAAGLLSADDVKAAMGGALALAGKTHDEGVSIVTWALAHPSTKSLPGWIK